MMEATDGRSECEMALRMSEIPNALGDGWLSKFLIVTVPAALAGAIGWLSRRPVEKATIMNAVTNQVDKLMSHQEAYIKTLTEAWHGATKAHEACEARVEQLSGEVGNLKQTIASMSAIQP